MTTPVLICDDSSVARKQMARTLPSDWDIEVSFATNGEEAVATVSAATCLTVTGCRFRIQQWCPAERRLNPDLWRAMEGRESGRSTIRQGISGSAAGRSFPPAD